MLDWTEVKYGGSGGACSLAMLEMGTNPTGCAPIGGSSVKASRSTFTRSAGRPVGLYGAGNAATIQLSHVGKDPLGRGISVIGATADLRYNYWDDVSGPGPAGTGVGITWTAPEPKIKPWRCNEHLDRKPLIIVHGFQPNTSYSAADGVSCYDGTNTTLGEIPGWFEDDGHDVWLAHLTTGPRGTDSLKKNGAELAKQVQHVYEASDRRKVDIVAHSSVHVRPKVSSFCKKVVFSPSLMPR